MSLTALYLDYLENDLNLERDLFIQSKIALLDGRQRHPDSHLERTEILVVTETHVDDQLLKRMPNLRLVIRHGTGYDTIDIQACTNAGIAVVTFPNYCTHEVVEHTLAFIFTIVRNLNKAQNPKRSEEKGPWQKVAPIHRLSTSIIGIIGYGQIGQHLAAVLTSLGVRVLVYTPHPTLNQNVTFVSLVKLMESCDIISIHSSLNTASSNLINAKTISLMKKNAWIINTSRGGIIDQEALFKAIKKKQIGGAAIDVIDASLPFPHSEISTLSNLLYTPHLAWYSEESILEIRNRIIEVVLHFQKTGQVLEKCINSTVLTKKQLG
jgi:D-3-phosphoglycerate dehydrogenase / 2-oxoglutarate reductase